MLGDATASFLESLGQSSRGPCYEMQHEAKQARILTASQAQETDHFEQLGSQSAEPHDISLSIGQNETRKVGDLGLLHYEAFWGSPEPSRMLVASGIWFDWSSSRLLRLTRLHAVQVASESGTWPFLAKAMNCGPASSNLGRCDPAFSELVQPVVGK